MSRTLRRLCWSAFWPAPVALADVPGSTDLDYLPRFPRAEIVDYRVQEGTGRAHLSRRAPSAASAGACAWTPRSPRSAA